MVFLLDEETISFPDPTAVPEEMREADGCLAFGGDLLPDRLLLAYSHGIFPWYPFRDSDIYWFCPMERFVIFPSKVHVSHSLRTLLNKGEYRCTIDKDFSGVIEHCASLRIDQEGAWLGPDMIKAYKLMHDYGYAHSVEVWRGEELVGGLYGMLVGNGFMGESMFSLAPSASKVALVHLCRTLEEEGVAFVDCQFKTPHLASMGGEYISYKEYMDLLQKKSE